MSYTLGLLLLSALCFMSAIIQRQINRLQVVKEERGYRCQCAYCGYDGRPVQTYPIGHVFKIDSEARPMMSRPDGNATIWVIAPVDNPPFPPRPDSAE